MTERPRAFDFCFKASLCELLGDELVGYFRQECTYQGQQCTSQSLMQVHTFICMLRNGLASFPDSVLPEKEAMLYALSRGMIFSIDIDKVIHAFPVIKT